MNIHELDSYNLADAVKFHRRLNPRIWGRDEHLLPEVRDKLLAIAEDFQEFLGVGNLDVQDITISGSNAAYSYTKNSDIDLHLVVNMPDNPIYQELFTAKKYQYNSEHNIRIGGAEVELYVQPADQKHISQGIYSVKDGEWIQVPQRKRAQIDDACVRDKTADLDARIHSAIKSKNVEAISTLWNKIKAMRSAGLENHGEFGCENLAFKLLRNRGCIKLLKDAMTASQDRELSLREAPVTTFRYGYGSEVDETSLADMRAAFAADTKPQKQEVFHSPYEYEKVKKQREAERQEKIEKIARTPVKPWTGGLEEGHQGQPYSSEDGVAASTKMFCEDTDDTLVHEFIQHTAMELGIDPMPTIKLHTDPEWSTHNHSFGRYDPDTHTLNVSMPNRHILDVLRTTAHELVHCSQNQQHGRLPDDAGETGSDWENDANARAGIIMRDWANTHPEHFELPALGEGASGYIPKNKREAAMPQYAMALSVDIKPGQTGKEANKLALNTGRNGEPGLLMKTVNLRESTSDYQIRNTEKLDRVLAKCCAMIEHRQQKDPERYGMVAACVIDPDNRMIASTSVNHNGRWIHAERMAINKYHKQHGDIPPGSIVVTTLSPCNSPMDDRAGESCKDLLNSAGIHKAYCGYIDPTQHDDDDADFTVGVTQNDDLWDSCKAFADTFLHEGLNEDVEDFPIANVRKPNGAIGNQGVNTNQAADVLTHAAGMQVSPDWTMRQMVDALRADPAAQQRLRQFVQQNPVTVYALPDGSYHLQDGHHRTFLLNLLGDKTVPAIVKEDVKEANTVEFEGLTLKVIQQGHELVVDALDDWGNKVLGHVRFNIGDGQELDPQDLRVDDKYQGQGIARVMYDYVKSLGYTINRSWDQTDAGAGFWNKHRGEDVRVWEQGMAEGSDRIAANKQDRLDALENKLIAKGYIRTKDPDRREYQYKWTKDGAPTYVVNYRFGSNGYAEFWKEQGMAENFADGKNPGRKGLSKRVGVNTKASVSDLRKTAKNSSGEKQRMAHWLANMKAGRAKAKRK